MSRALARSWLRARLRVAKMRAWCMQNRHGDACAKREAISTVVLALGVGALMAWSAPLLWHAGFVARAFLWVLTPVFVVVQWIGWNGALRGLERKPTPQESAEQAAACAHRALDPLLHAHLSPQEFARRVGIADLEAALRADQANRQALHLDEATSPARSQSAPAPRL